MKSIALLVAALGCTACTSLKVHEFNPALPASRVGIPYPLGFTQYKIELTRRVIACGNEMKVAAAAKIEETRNAPDPQRRYVIDPNSLGSMVKTSDVKLEYHPNGLVGALNASAVDKTGDIIANVGTTAVKIASLAAAAGGPAGACKPEVVQALADVEAQQAKVATANDVLERSLARMKRAREKVEALGAATDESAKAEASKAYDELIVSTSRQKAETEKLDALLAKITYKQVVRWPENGDVGRGVYRMDPDVLANWALNLSGDPLNPARAQLDIFIQLETVSSDGRPLPLVRPGDSAAPPTGSGIDEKIDPALGIPFRQPGYGELKICNINFCDRGGEVLATQAGSALQLGQIYYLPCRSRPFTSVECKFELTEDGWLKSMGTSNKEAALAGATNAAKSLFESAGTIQSTLSGAGVAALEAKTKALKAQADYQAAVSSLAANPNAASLAEVAALNANIEVARARKNLIEAEAELVRAQGSAADGGQ